MDGAGNTTRTMDASEAYRILGVPEGASRNEVENKYAIYVKRYRASRLEGTATDSDEKKMEELTRAYNYLMDYEFGGLREMEEQLRKSESPILKKLGIDQRKASNFLYYYKFHIIIGIIAIIVIVSTIRSCANTVKPDLNVVFIGDYYAIDTTVLEQEFKKDLVDAKAVSVQILNISDGTDRTRGEQDYAMLMKATALMAANDIDVYILDKVNFARYAKEGTFLSLDSLAEELNVDMEKNKAYRLIPDGETSEHLYGIEIPGKEYFKNLNLVTTKETILAIHVNVQHKDNAIRLVKQLVSSVK